MGSEITHDNATVVCDHQAMARPAKTSTRVKVSGKGVVTTPSQYTVSACPFSTPDGPKPCATINFTTGAQRVKVENQYVLLKSSSGMAIGPLPVQGNGTVRVTQTRVKAE